MANEARSPRCPAVLPRRLGVTSLHTKAAVSWGDVCVPRSPNVPQEGGQRSERSCLLTGVVGHQLFRLGHRRHRKHRTTIRIFPQVIIVYQQTEPIKFLQRVINIEVDLVRTGRVASRG